MPDYYAILGVNVYSSKEDIAKAYRKIAVICHPDINPHIEVAEEFKKAALAYEILSDDAKRVMYEIRLYLSTI